jgi:hypothetical protein
MNLSTLDHIGQGSPEALVVDPASLYHVLEKVKGRRGKKGIRYSLALLLPLILLGKTAGQTKIARIIYWTNERENDLRKLLNWPKEFPSHWAYTNALAHCNDQEVVQAIAQVILKARATEVRGDEPRRLLAEIEQGEENLIRKARDRWENRELQWLEFTNPLTPSSNEKERATFLQEFVYLLHKYKDLYSRPSQISFTFWLKYMLSQQDTREGTE